MSEADTLYYFFHNCYDAEFVSSVNSSLGEWMFIHSIKAAAVKEFLLYLVVLLVIEINIFLRLEDWLKGCKSMMKKIIPVIVTVLIICLSVPSVPAFAAADGLNKFVTTDLLTSVGANTTFCSPQFQYADSAFSNIDIDKFNDFSNLPLDPINDPCVYVLSGNPQSTIFITMFDMSDYVGTYSAVCSDAGLTIRTTNTAEQMPQFQGHTYQFNVGTGVWSQAYSSGTFSFTRSQEPQIVLDKIEGQPDYQENPGGSNKAYCKVLFNSSSLYGYYTYASSVISNFFYSNADVYYSRNQFWEYYAARDTATGSQITNNFNNALFSGGDVLDSLTNYLGFGYYNGSEYVDQGGGSDEPSFESNENHLYLNNFNIQFCKPFNSPDVFSSAGGGYAAFTYDFDSWINSHHSDYRLEILTNILVDGGVYQFTKQRDLDVSGVLVLPFNGLAPGYNWENENLLFVQYPNRLFGNYNLGYIYSVTFDKYSNNVARFLGSGRSNRLFFRGHDLESDFDDMVGSAVESLFTSVTHSQFQISFVVNLVDTVSGEYSGTYTKTFDLLNGVYTVSNNTISDNSNPYEYSDENPYLPIENSGGGYLPSTNNNLVTNNINIPSNYTVTYRDGVNTFIDWFNQDPEVTGIQNSFWGAMGVFKGNPANELYSDYFGFLPAGFKSIIFGCAGIGIIGCAATILRKRLMK